MQTNGNLASPQNYQYLRAYKNIPRGEVSNHNKSPICHTLNHFLQSNEAKQVLDIVQYLVYFKQLQKGIGLPRQQTSKLQELALADIKLMSSNLGVNSPECFFKDLMILVKNGSYLFQRQLPSHFTDFLNNMDALHLHIVSKNNYQFLKNNGVDFLHNLILRNQLASVPHDFRFNSADEELACAELIFQPKYRDLAAFSNGLIHLLNLAAFTTPLAQNIISSAIHDQNFPSFKTNLPIELTQTWPQASELPVIINLVKAIGNANWASETAQYNLAISAHFGKFSNHHAIIQFLVPSLLNIKWSNGAAISHVAHVLHDQALIADSATISHLAANLHQVPWHLSDKAETIIANAVIKGHFANTDNDYCLLFNSLSQIQWSNQTALHNILQNIVHLAPKYNENSQLQASINLFLSSINISTGNLQARLILTQNFLGETALKKIISNWLLQPEALTTPVLKRLNSLNVNYLACDPQQVSQLSNYTSITPGDDTSSVNAKKQVIAEYIFTSHHGNLFKITYSSHDPEMSKLDAAAQFNHLIIYITSPYAIKSKRQLLDNLEVYRLDNSDRLNEEKIALSQHAAQFSELPTWLRQLIKNCEFNLDNYKYKAVFQFFIEQFPQIIAQEIGVQAYEQTSIMQSVIQNFIEQQGSLSNFPNEQLQPLSLLLYSVALQWPSLQFICQQELIKSWPALTNYANLVTALQSCYLCILLAKAENFGITNGDKRYHKTFMHPMFKDLASHGLSYIESQIQLSPSLADLSKAINQLQIALKHNNGKAIDYLLDHYPLSAYGLDQIWQRSH